MRSDTAQEACGIRILRMPDTLKKTGLSRSSVYQRIRENTFPQPVRLGVRTVGFVEHEVDDFLSHLMLDRKLPKDAQVVHGGCQSAANALGIV